jgi:hypothetical protein
MKNLILTALVFITLSMVSISCEKDNPGTGTEIDLTGTYEVYIDGSVVVEGTTLASGSAQNADGVWINTVTMGDEAKSMNIVVGQFPRTVGETVTMDTDSDPGVIFTHQSVMYSTISGTLTRETASKISFSGSCVELMTQEEHSVKGFVESDSYKQIK